MKSFKTIMTALAVFTIFQFSLNAQTETSTWVGPTNGSWGDATNWSPEGVPTSRNVFIPTESEVNIDVISNAVNLTVESNAIINKTGNLALTINGIGNFADNSTLNFIEGNINGGSNLLINGAINIIGGGNKALFGLVTINTAMNIASGVSNFSTGSSAMITITQDAILTVGEGSISNASFGATIRNEGLIRKTVGSGSFTFNSGIKVQNINGTINVDNGSMILASQSDLTNGVYNVTSGGSLTFGPSVNNNFIGTLNGQLDGPFIINGGISLTTGEDVTFNFSGTSGVEWAGGALVGSGATLINQGLLTVTGGGSSASQLNNSHLRNNAILIFEENTSFSLSGANALLENTSSGIIAVNDGFTTTTAGGANYLNEGLLQKTEGAGTVNFRAVINNQ